MSKKNQISSLIQSAKDAQKFSQAKYSSFNVGAALETVEGDIFTGCNIESSSYGLTICAERVALTKALSEGKLNFKRIAIIGPDNDFCPPCGACRQLLYDYTENLTIILTDGQEIKQITLDELLPHAFSETKLRLK